MKYNVRITKVEGTGAMKARASVNLADDSGNDMFAVYGFRVMEGKNGMFVNMPSGQPYEKDGKKVYPEQFFPVSKDAREELVKAVLDAYNAS